MNEQDKHDIEWEREQREAREWREWLAGHLAYEAEQARVAHELGKDPF